MAPPTASSTKTAATIDARMMLLLPMQQLFHTDQLTFGRQSSLSLASARLARTTFDRRGHPGHHSMPSPQRPARPSRSGAVASPLGGRDALPRDWLVSPSCH